jgi:hypothetical protein
VDVIKYNALTQVSDLMKRMVLDKSPQLFRLLTYIKDHENEEKTTYREKIVDYMRDQKLSSRLTTLNIINTLLQEGVLLEEGVMNYQSNLKINSKYDFDNLLSEVLSSQIQELRSKLEPLRRFANGTPKMDKIFKMTLKHIIITPDWKLFGQTESKKVKTTPKIT